MTDIPACSESSSILKKKLNLDLQVEENKRKRISTNTRESTHSVVVSGRIHNPVPLIQRRNVGQYGRCEKTHLLRLTDAFV